MKRHMLIGRDGVPYGSAVKGTQGGRRRMKHCGRPHFKSALRVIAQGKYVKRRVLFAAEATAIAAGYQTCFVCVPDGYRAWKQVPQ